MTEEEYVLTINNIDEEWKQLILKSEYQNYDISNTGKLRNHKTGKMYSTTNPFGTYNMYSSIQLTLNDGTKLQTYLHRLIAIMFIPIPRKYLEMNISIDCLEVDHIDNIRSHNVVSNLQWLTHMENMDKMFKSYTYTRSLKPSDDEIEYICRLLQDGYIIYEISKLCNYSEKLIYDIRYGMTHKKISKKYTFPPLSNNFNENIYNKMKELLLEGESKLKIAVIFNTTVDIINKIESNMSFEEINEIKIQKNIKMTVNNKQSKDLIIKICEMLQNGLQPKKVAAITGIPKSTIQHIAQRETHTSISKNYVFDYDKCKIPDSTIKKLCEMIKENKIPLTEIAKEMGVSYSFAKSIKYKKSRTDISYKYF